MKYDCIIIGAGLSGLSAASLLAKRGLSVAVCEHASKPGGSCGIFKRQLDAKPAVFDQGSSMLFGFGDHGFNAHRYLFNCLEEPIHVIKHDHLYAVNYDGKRIKFPGDIDQFITHLSSVFPHQANNIRRFYKDMGKLYKKVISENPSFTTPDETDPLSGIKSILKHPAAYFRFLSYLNISADKLLRKYFDDDEILKFFDKLTSTYCYATLEEAPAILASVMFIDNHEGGSWYPAGSTLFLPGILEKVIEENGGHMYYDTTVEEILFRDTPGSVKLLSSSARGVLLGNGHRMTADNIIFSGTVWDLYGKLLPDHMVTEEMLKWTGSQEATYSSLVLYAVIDKEIPDEDICAIEMLASSPGVIDESEVTVYIPSIDDKTLCDDDHHILIAIGPSFLDWDPKHYHQQKEQESARIISLLENRFPGISDHIIYRELATPFTIERYTMKYCGAAAGPKQKLGQHMLKRQSIRTAWPGLYCCGESTTMGTGTPTVTISGIAAANAVLKKYGMKPYVWKKDMKDHVVELKTPVEKGWVYDAFPEAKAKLMTKAGKCLFCENPGCCSREIFDIPAVMRRAACGNFKGASDIINNAFIKLTDGFWEECEAGCVQEHFDISGIFHLLSSSEL